LEAPNIAASADTVVTWTGPYPKFARINLMMDGKIYIMPFSWTHYGHYIQYPNRKGAACEVVLGGVYFPIENFATTPHFPNYRLGPLEDSACDTLGLLNHPLAWWRSDKDTTALHLVFTDNSSYNPETWHWDFGDGQVSSDTSPVHLYSQTGTYLVCLTVCNTNGCDTMCRGVNIETIGTEEPQYYEPIWTLYPNPAWDYLNIHFEYTGTKSCFSLVNVLGQTVLSQNIAGLESSVALSGVKPGLYLGVLTMQIGVFKVIVSR